MHAPGSNALPRARESPKEVGRWQRWYGRTVATQTLIRTRPDGPWHRRSGDPRTTACGEKISGPVASREQKPEDNNLCPSCFTRHEIDTGKMEKLKRELEKQSDQSLFYNEDDEPTDPDADENIIKGEVIADDDD